MKHVLNSLKYTLTFGVFALCLSCNNTSDSDQAQIPNGEGKLEVDGGRIWYKVSGTGTQTPLVLLHGGPGYSSFYLKPLEELGDDRQVIRYDQLGSGKSDVIKDTTLFTIDHFVDELEMLRTHLGVETWHVLGHSWGTILAFEYYKKYPDRVSSLVLGSPCIDIAAWEQSTTQLLQTLPDSLQHAVLYADSTGNYEDPLYEVAINAFYDKYLWGSHVVEADLDSLVNTANLDIYTYMWGPSELAPTGTLKHYNGMQGLQDVDIPTLFTVGEHDEIQPSFVKEMAAPFTNSRIEVFASASHLTTWDARDENIRVVREFLYELDANAALQR